MKRAVALALIVALAVAVGGCSKSADVDKPDLGGSVDGSQESTTRTAQSADAFEAIPADGAGESAALAALPQALVEAQPMHEASGMRWPSLAGVEPFLNAYIISADMNGQAALLEVRADGIAHGMYAYQRAFDAATLIWAPAESFTSPRAEPQSERERAAVDAIRAALSDEFPEAAPSVAVYGYRFVYARDGAVVLILEVATDGSVISVGS